MTPTMPKEGTQPRKVLEALLRASGEWVGGRYFLHTLYLSQFHARIKDLEDKFGWTIQHSEFTDNFGFKSYRIAEGAVPLVTL